MSMLTRSFVFTALVACIGTAPLQAQQPSSRAFQWYVGGHGGVLSVQPNGQDRTELPLGGAHLLVTARRTALLLSVEHAFGDDEMSSYDQLFVAPDSTITQATIPVTFNYVRKYSAMLLAFPIRAPISPYFGIGVGIMHAGGLSDPDDDFARDAASHGFGSLLGGLELRVSRLTAFGQYQVTTGPGRASGSAPAIGGGTFFYSGRLLDGPTHAFTAGLRISLGSAREGY